MFEKCVERRGAEYLHEISLLGRIVLKLRTALDVAVKRFDGDENQRIGLRRSSTAYRDQADVARSKNGKRIMSSIIVGQGSAFAYLLKLAGGDITTRTPASAGTARRCLDRWLGLSCRRS